MAHTDESQVSLRCVANVTFCHCCFLLCFGLEGEIVSNIALLPPHGTQPPNTYKYSRQLYLCHFICFGSVFHLLSSFLAVFQGYVAAGSGEPGGDEYHSLVLYHNNSPRWAEQIKLPIPVDMFRGSHVRFEFRHCSSKYDCQRNRTFLLTRCLGFSHC